MNVVHWLRSLVCGTGVLMLTAGAVLCATVETTDQRELHGEVSFPEPNTILVRTNESQAATLSYTQVRRIRFDDSRVKQALWEFHDIGNVFLPGSMNRQKDANTVLASGWGWWNSSDAFGFAGLKVSTGGELIARISRFHDSNGVVLAGITFRQSLAPNAPHVTIALSSARKARLKSRPLATLPSAVTREGASWLRLRSVPDGAIGYTSNDGQEWDPLDEAPFSFGSDIYVGLVSATVINGFIGGATFSDCDWHDQGRGRRFVDLPSKGIVLTDGSILAGKPIFRDQSMVGLERAGERWQIPWPKIAAILLRPAPKAAVLREGAAQPGVLMAGGDFLEGRIAFVNTNAVTIDSILFGLKKIPLNGHPSAIVVSGIFKEAAPCQVRLMDDSMLFATDLVSEDSFLRIKHPLFDGLRANLNDLVEVTFAGSRSRSN